VQRRPESIPRPREVMPNRSRVKARIDSAEKNLQVWRNYIRQCLARSGNQLFLCRFEGLASCHAPLLD
jgi:hypothetical protein